MNAQLLLWIVETFTKPGETILDPMAGSGTTMLACILGRHCILVELEEKFIEMCQNNWEKIRHKPQPGYEMGTCQIIQGDARNLSTILCDKIITSQPYPAISPAHTKEGEELRLKIAKERGVSPDKVSFLDYTKKQVNSIITSPPYAQMAHGSVEDKISSGFQSDMARAIIEGSVREYSDNLNNIGNLPYGSIDGIITSPPYEGTIERTKEGTRRGIRSRMIDQQKEYGMYIDQASDNNIGNLKSTSYLQAMLQVYQECFRILRPGGLMILVTKNFIRNKQIVRLDLDTIKLCELAEFTFVERHYRKLLTQSFWRALYYKKYPMVERIDYEDILVFYK